MSKQYKLAVFIGRMAPLHHAHQENIDKALELADNVLVIFGSSNVARTEVNPFSNTQRCDMFDLVYPESTYPNLSVTFMQDNSSDELWAAAVRLKVETELGKLGYDLDTTVALVGHQKDETSFYLDMFPKWDFIETGATINGMGIETSATFIRDKLFTGKFNEVFGLVHPFVYQYIKHGFIGSIDYARMKAEYDFHRAYPEHRRKTYPINDVTADAVVLCAGHILLIRRKNVPGKGLLALPGGFVQTNETVLDGAIRELLEETKIHVPEKVLRGSIVSEKMFDNPKRSLRGRIITFAFKIQIARNHNGDMPRVYGSDDAAKAEWVPLEKIWDLDKASRFFEDHHHIIRTMIGTI